MNRENWLRKRFCLVGSRPSRLARKQAEELQRLFPGMGFEFKYIATLGDRDKAIPLSRVEDADFFTREIDQALLKREIDLAVHSSKDLPDVLPKGLGVVLETPSISRFDCLLTKNKLKLRDLPAGSRIGTSSQRRKEQVHILRADLESVEIRGNIEERIALLDNGIIDALIVAHAALIRLGLEERITEIFPLSVFKTHPKQGSLSLVAREEDCQRIKSILSEQDRAIGN